MTDLSNFVSPAPKPTFSKKKKPTFQLLKFKRPRWRNVKRHSKEWIRAYESDERRAFVQSLACVVCTMIHKDLGIASAGFSENAHTVTGGRGRKADANTIAPLCSTHHEAYDHHDFPCDKPIVRQAIKDAAPQVEERWQEHLRSKSA